MATPNLISEVEVWRIECIPTDIETTFPTADEAYDFVASLQELRDPAYQPQAVVKSVTMVTVTEERHPLPTGPTVDQVLPGVQEALVKLGALPQGVDSLRWAVAETLKQASQL